MMVKNSQRQLGHYGIANAIDFYGDVGIVNDLISGSFFDKCYKSVHYPLWYILHVLYMQINYMIGQFRIKSNNLIFK